MPWPNRSAAAGPSQLPAAPFRQLSVRVRPVGVRNAHRLPTLAKHRRRLIARHKSCIMGQSNSTAMAESARESCETEGPGGARVVSILSDNLAGQDKWLGGALGSDGAVYGVPGSARTVLKVVPETGEVTTFGGPFPGKFKWLRGIPVGDEIYCIPSNASSVLVIRVGGTPEAIAVDGGDLLIGDWMYHGGVLADDGCIYAVPCNSTNVLKIEPGPEPRLSVFGSLPDSRQKWYGGLLGSDGCIYCIPNNADQVLKIIPGETPRLELFGDFPSGGWKWHGGCVGGDGRIYGIPAHADSVLCIEPGPQPVAFTYGGPIKAGGYRPGGKYKYGGGVAAPNGAIYAFPSDAERVLKILPPDSDDPEKVSLIGPTFDEAHNKWQNGFVGRDGNVYAIPLNAAGVLQVVTATDGVSSIGALDGRDKWEGGVEANDGALYFMPLRAKYVAKIVPGEAEPQ